VAVITKDLLDGCETLGLLEMDEELPVLIARALSDLSLSS